MSDKRLQKTGVKQKTGFLMTDFLMHSFMYPQLYFQVTFFGWKVFFEDALSFRTFNS